MNRIAHLIVDSVHCTNHLLIQVDLKSLQQVSNKLPKRGKPTHHTASRILNVTLKCFFDRRQQEQQKPKCRPDAGRKPGLPEWHRHQPKHLNCLEELQVRPQTSLGSTQSAHSQQRKRKTYPNAALMHPSTTKAVLRLPRCYGLTSARLCWIVIGWHGVGCRLWDTGQGLKMDCV